MDAWNLQITGFLDPNEVSFPSQDDAIGKVIPAKNQRLDGKAVKEPGKKARRAARLATLERAYDKQDYDRRSCRIQEIPDQQQEEYPLYILGEGFVKTKRGRRLAVITFT